MSEKDKELIEWFEELRKIEFEELRSYVLDYDIIKPGDCFHCKDNYYFDDKLKGFYYYKYIEDNRFLKIYHEKNKSDLNYILSVLENKNMRKITNIEFDNIKEEFIRKLNEL